jgi:catechol-2,3-dioxygenase
MHILSQLVQDPSGYLWEVQPAPEDGMEPFRELNLLVSDIEASERFYCDALGMSLVGRESGEEYFRVCGRCP